MVILGQLMLVKVSKREIISFENALARSQLLCNDIRVNLLIGNNLYIFFASAWSTLFMPEKFIEYDGTMVRDFTAEFKQIKPQSKTPPFFNG